MYVFINYYINYLFTINVDEYITLKQDNIIIKDLILHLCTFTPLKISIRTADESSTKLPVTV